MPLQPADRVAAHLIEIIDDPVEEIRAAIATKLGQLKSTRSVAPLAKLVIHDCDPLVHSAATSALATFPPESWVGLLVRALDDSDPKVADAASLALRTIGWAYLDPPTRAKVAVLRFDWSLATEMGRDAVPVLQSKLRTGSPVIRREAAEALCKIADESSMKAIVEVLRDRRADPGARETAAWALRTLQWCEVDPADAARAAIAVGSWTDAIEIGVDAVIPLSQALRDANPKTRLAAAESLGAIGGSEATDVLGATLVDQSVAAGVRAVAAQELGRIGSEQVIAFLIAGLSDKDWAVRQSASKSLSEMGWQPMRPWDRALYAIATGRIEDAVAVGPAAIPALADALRFPTVSGNVGNALARMGREGTDALAAIAKDAKTELAVREAASTALASVGDGRAIDPLHTMLSDADPVVRQTAVWALERLGWEPKAENDRAVFLLAHKDWESLARVGAGAVDPLLQHLTVEEDSQQALDTLQKIMETASRRVSVQTLRRIIRFGESPGSKQIPGEGDTATLVYQATAKLAKTARFELLRRGILK